jgi:hypothetical protein
MRKRLLLLALLMLVAAPAWADRVAAMSKPGAIALAARSVAVLNEANRGGRTPFGESATLLWPAV